MLEVINSFLKDIVIIMNKRYGIYLVLFPLTKSILIKVENSNALFLHN